jgi:hypothetical protein
MSGQKPTIGRIVHYRAASAEQRFNGAEVYPAIITQVFGGDAANLLCMPPFAPPFHEGSVPMNETNPRSWFWPPREPAKTEGGHGHG